MLQETALDTSSQRNQSRDGTEARRLPERIRLFCRFLLPQPAIDRSYREQATTE